MKGAKNVEEFIMNYPEWQESLILLRDIFLSAGLEETIKWGVPVYVSKGKNVAGMACFKSYMGIWFYQGALLADKHNKLINAQEGVTKALRQWRFTSTDEVAKEIELIRKYTLESIDNFKKGKEKKPDKDIPLQLPPELAAELENSAELKQKFEALTLTNRRDYAEHIETAKRAETKAARLEKIIPMIMRGEGLHDKYKK